MERAGSLEKDESFGEACRIKNEFRKERTVMPDKRLAGQTIMVRV